MYELRRTGARVAHLTWALKCGTQGGLRNESVLHVDADALLIHPAFSIIRIVGEVRGIFLSWNCRPVIPLVRPKLITAITKMTLAIVPMRKRGPRQT